MVMPDSSLITVTNFCDTLIYSVVDVGNGSLGCANDTLVVTRTYTVTDGTGATMQCVRVFEVVDDLAPELVGDCPADTSTQAYWVCRYMTTYVTG